MYIYRVSQNKANEWGSYSQMIVAANSLFEATRLHPLGDWTFRHIRGYPVWATDPDEVGIQRIGVADISLGKHPKILCVQEN